VPRRRCACVYPSGPSPAVDPVFDFGIGRRLPPLVAGGNERLFSGSSERKAFLTRRHELGDGPPVAGDDYAFTFFDELEKPRQLQLGLMHVDLHVSMFS
jgi:hypothetical protein